MLWFHVSNWQTKRWLTWIWWVIIFGTGREGGGVWSYSSGNGCLGYILLTFPPALVRTKLAVLFQINQLANKLKILKKTLVMCYYSHIICTGPKLAQEALHTHHAAHSINSPEMMVPPCRRTPSSQPANESTLTSASYWKETDRLEYSFWNQFSLRFCFWGYSCFLPQDPLHHSALKLKPRNRLCWKGAPPPQDWVFPPVHT